MFVKKRDGRFEIINIQKISNKISKFNKFPTPLSNVDVDTVVKEVVKGLCNNMNTSEIDEFTSKECMNLSLKHPNYGILGSRIIIDNHHKNTKTSFKDKMESLYYRKDNKGDICPLLDKTFFKYICFCLFYNISIGFFEHFK